LAAGDIDEPHQARKHSHHGEASHAERSGKAWSEKRALSQDHLIERLRATGVAHLPRIAAEVVKPKRHAGDAGVHQKVHRPRRLIVGLARVEDEAILALPAALA